MKHTLKTLYAWIDKHYPEICQAHIEAYCNESGKLKKEDVEYHYGYNSLKWLIYSLRETLDNKTIEQLFYQILVERKALDKSFYDLQYRILSFPAAKAHKQFLADHQPDLSRLIRANLFGYTIILNPTTQNLTSMLLGKQKADAVIFKNPQTDNAGIVFNVSGSLFKKEAWQLKLLHYILSVAESGWVPVDNSEDQSGPPNLHIRKGEVDPTVHSIETLLATLGKTLRPHSNMFAATYELPGGGTQQFSGDDLTEVVSICTGHSKEFTIDVQEI